MRHLESHQGDPFCTDKIVSLCCVRFAVKKFGRISKLNITSQLQYVNANVNHRDSRHDQSWEPCRQNGNNFCVWWIGLCMGWYLVHLTWERISIVTSNSIGSCSEGIVLVGIQRVLGMLDGTTIL